MSLSDSLLYYVYLIGDIMKNTLIENALEFARNVFSNDFGGHDYFHTERVYKTAISIAEREGADITVVSLSAILHDVDDAKLSPGTSENKDNARRFMRENGVDDAVADKVCRIIGQISFSGTGESIPESIEGRCVQDADRLDAIGAIGIARAFAFGGSRNREMYNPDVPPKMNMTKEEYRNSNSTSLNHFYEKLFLLKNLMNTQTAKEIAEQRDSFMKSFVDEFLNEWNGKV